MMIYAPMAVNAPNMDAYTIPRNDVLSGVINKAHFAIL